MPRFVNADSLFRIGKAHAVCQDYAAHCVGDNVAVAHLSDGCSTAASEHQSGGGKPQVYTDLGSRLMVLAAQRRLRVSQRLGASECYNDNLDQTTSTACRNVVNIGLSPDAISATLLSLEAGNGNITGRISGDGWFAARRKDGSGWEVLQVEYLSGAPYYPRYSINPLDYATYLVKFGPRYDIRMWQWAPGQSLDSVRWTVRNMELPEPSGLVNEGRPEFHYDEFVWETNEFDLVLAFSDGLSSFGKLIITDISRDTEVVPPHLPLSVIVNAIKGTRGTFLSRNFGGPMGVFREFAKLGWEHHDDLAVIGVFSNGEE